MYANLETSLKEKPRTEDHIGVRDQFESDEEDEQHERQHAYEHGYDGDEAEDEEEEVGQVEAHDGLHQDNGLHQHRQRAKNNGQALVESDARTDLQVR